MNIDEIAALGEKIEECQLDLIRAAGREQCENTSRLEAHIFKALTKAAGYADMLRQSAERAEQAERPQYVFSVCGRIAA